MARELPFAGRVTEALGRSGLTLRGLCRETGLDPSFFSKVLAGKRSPPSDEPVLRRIAKVLDLDAAELIVSAGRIPSEWSRLWDEPELFRAVNRQASSGAAAAPGQSRPAQPAARPAPRPKPAERVSPALLMPARTLAEELL